MRIDLASLSTVAYFGLACVVCGHQFEGTEAPHRVAFAGDDRHEIFACPGRCIALATGQAIPQQPKDGKTT